MRDPTNKHWKHQLPRRGGKKAAEIGERLNLTWRRIVVCSKVQAYGGAGLRSKPTALDGGMAGAGRSCPWAPARALASGKQPVRQLSPDAGAEIYP